MPIHYDIETDALYLRGYAVGFELGRRLVLEKYNYLVVTNLLVETDFDVEKIALLHNVSLDFVQKVKEERPKFIVVQNLLLNKRLSDKKIALKAKVSLAFVQQVKFFLVEE